MIKKYRIEQNAPEMPHIWGATESLYWDQEIIDLLKKDIDGTLLEAAYDSVDWKSYYERLKGTPFYEWKEMGCGILTLGGPAHIKENDFFSSIGEISSVEDNFLKKHPELNQVLHDIHIEAAEQIINYILKHAPK